MKKHILTLIVFSLLTFSCKENDLSNVKETITSAQDNALIETQFTGVFEVTDDVASTDGRVKKTGGTILPSGASVVFEDSVFTDGDGIDFYIDFGPLGPAAPFGLLCLDGKYRAGRLNVKVFQQYMTIGLVASVSISEADAFYIGNGTEMYQLEGNVSITRTALEILEVAVKNAKLTDSNNKTITWNSNRRIERTFDAGPGIWMDRFRLSDISGPANGVNRNGEAFTISIDTPLVKKVQPGCHKTFVIGVLRLTNTSSNAEIRINYDPYNNGACDAFAEAEIGGKKTIFEVK